MVLFPGIAALQPWAGISERLRRSELGEAVQRSSGAKPFSGPVVRSRSTLLRAADADFVDVLQKIGGVVVDAIGAGAFEFFAAVAARE